MVFTVPFYSFQYLNGIVEKEVEQSLAPKKSIIMEPTAKSLDKELVLFIIINSMSASSPAKF